MSSPRLLLKNITLLENGVSRIVSAYLDNGILTGPPDNTANLKTVDCKNLYLSPGFTDIHCHIEPDTLDTEAARLSAEGVTSVLAAVMSGPLDAMAEDIEAIVSHIQNSALSPLEGIYCEGPFFSKAKKGAHSKEALTAADTAKTEKIFEAGNGLIKVLAYAPETAQDIDLPVVCRAYSCVPALGHTEASFELTLAELRKGACLGTHLFNCMGPLHHREPGAAGALLTDDSAYVELIADGIHVHPDMLTLACRCKPKDKLILITDSLRGLKDTVIQDTDKNAWYDSDGTLAGSTLTMPEAVKNTVKWGCMLLPEAAAAASSNPATLLGAGTSLFDTPADFVVFDKDLTILLTVKSGTVVYDKIKGIYSNTPS